jgi:hypothetical protein
MNHRVAVRTYGAHVSYRINVVCGFRLVTSTPNATALRSNATLVQASAAN